MSFIPKTAVEIERKYIIKMPPISVLQKQDGYTSSEITQIYIASPKGETHRVRRRKYSDVTRYYETRKIRIDSISSTEIEGEITEERFDELSAKMSDGTVPILKTRHTFIYMGQLFEIDVYPQWKNTAVMETELKSREERADIPDFITVIKEVTGDKTYSNAAMSRAFPPELL